MARKVTVDFFTLDQKNAEYVMYLIEEGPWPEPQLRQRLRDLEDRLYGAIDVAIDGYLAKQHPESSGMRVRVQVDLHDAPPEAEELVNRIAAHVAEDPKYTADLAKSPHIDGLRIVVKRPGEGRPN